MTVPRTFSKLFKWSAVAGGLLLLVAPAQALAQTCNGNSVLGIFNESMENPPAQAAPGGTGPLDSGTFLPQGIRLAQAMENGSFSNGCGTLAPWVGSVTVEAQSRTPVTSVGLGVGTLSGNLKVASQTLSGRVSGTLDFTPTDQPSPKPFVWANGSWQINGGDVQAGAFSGVALVPFQCGAPSGWCYYDITGALTAGYITNIPSVVPLDGSTDFNGFGDPEAKFVVTFSQ